MNQKIIFIFLIIAGTIGYITFESLKLDKKFSSFSNLQTNTVIKNLPEVTLPDFYTKKDFDFNKSIKEGNSLVVHFWATWCAPCEKEFPELVKLTELLEKNKKVKFLFIAVNDNEKDMKKFLNKFKKYTNFHVLVDNSYKHQKLFGTFRLPETFIFKSTGEVVHKYMGAQDWTQRHFVDLLYNL